MSSLFHIKCSKLSDKPNKIDTAHTQNRNNKMNRNRGNYGKCIGVNLVEREVGSPKIWNGADANTDVSACCVHLCA